MKNYTFTKTSNTNNNSFATANIGYITTGSTTDYSKILDDLIAADIADKNTYLYTYPKSSTKKTIYLDNGISKDSYDYIDAINFFKNYGKNSYHPYILGKTYELSDGTPIIFFEDSVQIGFDLFYFDDFNNPLFLKKFTTPLKKKIAEIYISGLKISIYK